MNKKISDLVKKYVSRGQFEKAYNCLETNVMRLTDDQYNDLWSFVEFNETANMNCGEEG